MEFDFYNPVKVAAGEGCVRKNSHEFSRLGKSCLIVTSGSAAKKSGALDDVMAALSEKGIKYEVFDGIGQNPLLETCMEAGKIARAHGLDFIVGIGGGSPMDAAKAVAVYAANPMDDGMDIYKMDWANTALPVAAIGTTAGTGSEVTSFSILTMPNGRKKSFGRDDTYPRIMFGDYRYTRTLPLDFTKSTALDALAHALEAYFNLSANGMTDIYAIEATRILCRRIEELRDATGIESVTDACREKLYFASIIAGYALSRCGTVFCHTIGYYFTEKHDIPHGFACAATLPDLVRRGVKYAPERANALFKSANTSEDKLCGLISDIAALPDIKLADEEISRISRDGSLTKNFAKTIPNGFSVCESEEMLKRLFGK